MRITLPEVSEMLVEYAGCGTHSLSITVAVVNNRWSDVEFVESLLKVLRDACPHEPVDGHDPYARRAEDLTCRHCDGRIIPDGPDQEGRQSWIVQ